MKIKLLLPFLFSVLCINAQDVQSLLSSYQYDKAATLLEGNDSLLTNQKMQQTLAGVYEKLGRQNEALELYNIILEKDGTSVEVLMRKGMLLLKQKDITNSLLCFEKLIDLQHDNSYFYQLAGQVAAEEPLFIGKALNYYKTGLELNPKNQEIALRYGNILLELKQATAASNVAHQFLKTDSTNKNMLLLDARAAYLKKDYKRVIKHTNRILAYGDTSLQGVRLLALSKYHQKEYSESIFWLEKLITSSQKEQMLFYLSMAHFRLDHLAEAEKYMKMAVESSISPNLGDYYTQLGVLSEAKGSDRDAITYFKKAYELTHNEDLLYRLALISEDYYKDKGIAEGYYETYLNQSDSSKTFYREYAQERLNDLKAARFFTTDSI